MIYKIDLHTHSIASPDGGLRLVNYADMLATGTLDYVAITDHDRIDFALEARNKLGDSIIVGEEISTIEGELIGLFLKEPVPAGLTARETAEHIRAQHGLVYVPHPFETVRKGMSNAALYKAAGLIDIIETYNGRAVFQNRSYLAEAWAREHKRPGAASSDTHGKIGWGKTYSEIAVIPTAKTLPSSLQHARLNKELVGFPGILYPKVNRIKKKLQHHA
jgi:predicted metal-dependent phosphoesterase TrpH